jgi:D-glycero-alpha-D-manno-heptose 1-phosphate guanylyltransferase
MITAVILAGGLGTRLQDTVSELPKPMAPINNRPFLEYQIEYWINQGVSKFILSVGYLRECIIEHFGNSYKNVPIEYIQEKQQLGTGGALLSATVDMNEVFLLLNGDTFMEVNLKTFYDFHVNSQSNWTFALYKMNHQDRYMGIKLTPNGKILSLNSNEDNKYTYINGGVYLINSKVLSSFKYKNGEKLSLENEILPAYFSNGGDLYGKEFKGKFIDIGIPTDYFRASQILENY